jgi:hypothetical protein
MTTLKEIMAALVSGSLYAADVDGVLKDFELFCEATITMRDKYNIVLSTPVDDAAVKVADYFGIPVADVVDFKYNNDQVFERHSVEDQRIYNKIPLIKAFREHFRVENVKNPCLAASKWAIEMLYDGKSDQSFGTAWNYVGQY